MRRELPGVIILIEIAASAGTCFLLSLLIEPMTSVASGVPVSN
jgi:hypothetical protein